MRRLLLVLALASCGKSDAPKATGTAPAGAPASAPASANDLKGTWSGTWTRKEIAGGGPLVLTLGEHPTLKRTGTACPPEETPVTVTSSGDQVTIEIATADVTGKLTGTRTGNEMSGELVMTCKLGTGHGTWSMTAQ
jgi:hypothetical protein